MVGVDVKKHKVLFAVMNVKTITPQNCFVSKHCTSIRPYVWRVISKRSSIKVFWVNFVQSIIFWGFPYTSYITHHQHNVTFPKECEDLRKENKFLSNEIHMERIMMRTENELTMRNLRNLNQELQSQVKEVHSNIGFIWVRCLYEFHKKKRSVSPERS